MATVEELVTPFGRELRTWRTLRGLSQLELASSVGSTGRHISFLETGRSRPSAGMVDRIVEQLDVPVRERNRVFEAAGLRGPYSTAGLHDPHLEPFRQALRSLLDQHLPFPGFAYDRTWDLVMANAAAEPLFSEGERNVVRVLFVGQWRHMMENWSTVAWAVLDRLRHDSLAEPDDAVLADLLSLATETMRAYPRPRETGSELAVCPTFVMGGRTVETVSVVARFGTPRHVATDDIRVELVFPADARDRDLFEAMAAATDTD